MTFKEFQKHVKSKDFINNGGKMIINNFNNADVIEIDERRSVVIDHRTYISPDDESWHVYPVALTIKGVYIVCPYCGQIHVHGVNPGGHYAGHRLDHCDNTKRFEVHPHIKPKHGGYFINEA